MTMMTMTDAPDGGLRTLVFGPSDESPPCRLERTRPSADGTPRALVSFASLVRHALRTLLALVILSGSAAGVEAQSPEDLVRPLARYLESYYLSTEVGQAYAAHLRDNLEAGSYDGLAPEELASTLTAGLLGVHEDGHLLVRYAPPPPAPPTPEGAGPPARPQYPDPVDIATRITPEIAYLRLLAFPSRGVVRERIAEFARSAAGSTTMILDLRDHMGGRATDADGLLSELFRDETPLLTMEFRAGIEEFTGPAPVGETMRVIDGPEGVLRIQHRVIPSDPAGLSTTELIVLTSGRTVSGAEHVAYAMKITGRGTLIGETTSGAGNFGRVVPIAESFRAFIPFGRTYDPETGEGWEVVGVEPHIATDAVDALRVALMRAGISAEDAAAIDESLSARMRFGR